MRPLTFCVVLWAMNMLVPMTYGENPGNSIRVMTTDFQFAPNVWTLAAGQEIVLTLTNNGVQEHEWVLLKQGEQVTIPFDADDEEKVFWEMEVGPGVTQEETFTAPHTPGTYTIVCGKPRHIERGMKATLVVQ